MILLAFLGFGGWGLGGDSYGTVNFNKASRIVNESLNLGIKFFDTSPTYGSGQSELVIGETLSDFSKKKDVQVCTKFGALPHTGRIMPFCFDPISLSQSLYSSRFRLKRDFLDIVLLHSPPPDLNKQDIYSIRKVINQELDSGGIINFGISLKSPSDYAYFLSHFPEITAFQFNFNLIDQRAKSCGLLDLLSNSNLISITRTPFVFGFLGNATKKTLFDTNDHRNNWNISQIDTWINSKDIFKDFADSLELSIAELALSFCLSTPNISYVIPGMLSSQNIKSNIKTSQNISLSSNQLSELYEIFKKHNFSLKSSNS